MNFINNLITRSISPASDIQPRLRGLFEPNDTGNAKGIQQINFSERFLNDNRDESNDVPGTPPQQSFNSYRSRLNDITNLFNSRLKEPLNESNEKEGNLLHARQRFQPDHKIVVLNETDGSTENDPVRYNGNVVPVSGDKKNLTDKPTANISAEKKIQNPAFSQTLVTTEKSSGMVKPASDYLKRPELSLNSNKKNEANSLMHPQAPGAATGQMINIEIGRIEIRVSQPPVIKQEKKGKEGPFVMNLEEYLDKRNQGAK